MGHSEYDITQWRRVLGAFQLTAPVRTKETLLLREERQLSLLRWIAEAVPSASRWNPVMDRYIDVIGSRVRAFGGDPTTVQPSPYGWPKPHPPQPKPHPGHHEHEAHSGKIAGLLFDRFGDFDGFILETEEHEHRYLSREREIETIAERAWRERLRVTVYTEHDEPHRAASIAIWDPPTHL